MQKAAKDHADADTTATNVARVCRCVDEPASENARRRLHARRAPGGRRPTTADARAHRPPIRRSPDRYCPTGYEPDEHSTEPFVALHSANSISQLRQAP